jgi:phosphotransferase system  glucose/maltose/N-acetylglucosamine-specific IIC component
MKEKYDEDSVEASDAEDVAIISWILGITVAALFTYLFLLTLLFIFGESV